MMTREEYSYKKRCISSQNKIQRFQSYLEHRIKKGVTNRKKLCNELRTRGYKGSYWTVYRYVNSILQNIHARTYKPSIRFETQPGQQAQVDWGSFGRIEINGRIERLYCFVYVLGYSRAMHIEFTIKQNLQTLENCHIHAFEQLGIPKEIVYDNMKTVVLRREKTLDGTVKPYYHPGFLDFSQHYGFQIKLCPPYWPRAKGKVEASVKYVRNMFMSDMRFNKNFFSLEELNEKAEKWLVNEANTRQHRATGERPVDRWEKEKKFLHFPNMFSRYETSSLLERKATKDGLVQYKSNFYSVPMHYARRKVFVKEKSQSGVPIVDIYFQNKIVATHYVSFERGRLIIDEDHLKIARQSNVNKKETKKRGGHIKNKTILEEYDFNRPLSYYDSLMPE